MKVLIEKSFDSDVKKNKDRNIISRLHDVILSIQNADSMRDIPQLRKIKGYDSFYRIKVGDYRIGLEEISSNEIALIRFLHRKDIYRYFPRR